MRERRARNGISLLREKENAMLTESDVWESNGIMTANCKAELDMPTLMELVRAIEAEVRAEAQEPAYAYRRKGLEHFCTCDEDRYAELAQKPNLFEVTTFYAAPQPPAPCPACVENEKTLQSIAEHVDWAFIGDLDDVVASRINERNDAIAHFAAECDALQAKVAELEKAYKDKDDAATQLVSAMRDMAEKIKEQSVEIERLTKVALFKESVCALYMADIERLKTVPMKYRRMAFNAQLQAKVAEQAALIEKCAAIAEAEKRMTYMVLSPLRTYTADEYCRAQRNSAVAVSEKILAVISAFKNSTSKDIAK